MGLLPGFVEAIGGKLVICYIDGKNLRGLCRSEEQARQFVESTLTDAMISSCPAGPALHYGAYFWKEDQDTVIDLWAHESPAVGAEEDGTWIRFFVFRNGKIDTTTPPASETTVIVSAFEGIARRRAPSHESFLHGPRPTLPDVIEREPWMGGGH